MKAHKISRRMSKRIFKKGIRKMHKKNLIRDLARGGYCL